MADEVVSLKGISEGMWKVYTETSAYLMDLDNKLAMRLPGEGVAQSDEAELAHLRGDGDWFTVHGFACEIGMVMTLICEGIAPSDIYTFRQTTLVKRIEKVDSDE